MLRIESSGFPFWTVPESADTEKEKRRKKKKHTNLASVDIARLIKLRVVVIQDGHVQSIRGCNVGTCITGLDNLGG